MVEHTDDWSGVCRPSIELEGKAEIEIAATRSNHVEVVLARRCTARVDDLDAPTVRIGREDRIDNDLVGTERRNRAVRKYLARCSVTQGYVATGSEVVPVDCEWLLAV